MYAVGDNNALAGLVGVSNESRENRAAYFHGNVEITENLITNVGINAAENSIKIDHPIDPENQYLMHSSVASPDRKNIYDGIATTDESGFATIELPKYFEALNKDFRYQFTVIGEFAQAIVHEKIKNNQFVIQTNKGFIEVSWQVTGIRKDKFAEKYTFEVEPMKAENVKGSYLHPDAHGVSKNKSESALKVKAAVRKEEKH